MLDAGIKGVAMNKIICCVAVAVAGLGGQAGRVPIVLNLEQGSTEQ